MSLWFKKQNFTISLCVIATILAYIYNYISLNGFIVVAVSGISAHLIQLRKELRYYLIFVVLIAITIAMLVSIVPHESYPVLLEQVRLSPHSKLFTLGVNIEKTLVAVLLATHLVKFNSSFQDWKNCISFCVWPSILVCCILLFPAIATKFIVFEPKFDPKITLLFAIHNLFLVCMAEEVFFRGIIQKWLYQSFSRYRYHLRFWLSILLTSLIFGLFHFRYGFTMMIFATIASMFYGYAYQKYRSIEASMMVHFCLNMVHFLIFTYPSLDRAIM